MRTIIGLVAALLMLLVQLAPALAQGCQLSPGQADSECYGSAFARGGILPCADDATGQVGICDYQHRCSSCLPQAVCAEIYLQGFVGCQEIPKVPAVDSISGVPVSALLLTGALFSPAEIPAFGAAAAAIIFAGGIAATRRKHKSARMKKSHISSLRKEKEELKKAKLDYGRLGAVLIALGVASIASGVSQSQTGLFVGDLAELGVNSRWAILALFAIFIIIYAWLCHEDAKKKKKSGR